MNSMVFDLLKALLIGICASAPIGPVVIYVMQITLTRSLKAGFSTGVGSAVIDTLYAAVALFAVSLVQDFLLRHQPWIMIIGGLIIIFVGYGMIVKDPMRRAGRPISARSMIGYGFKAAGCALANPGALALMVTLVAVFSLDVNTSPAPVWAIVMMVFLGALTFWLVFSWGISKLRQKIDNSVIYKLSRITGAIVVVLGAILIVRGIILFIK